MSRLIRGVRLEFLKIDKTAPIPIHRQIESQIRNAILTGIIKPGLRLPASRVLGQDLGASRPTIVKVYEYLSFEGFLETRRGAGTYVSQTLPDYIPQKIIRPDSYALQDSPNVKPLSKVGMEFGQLGARFDRCPLAAFLPNVPAFDHFPYSRWRKIQTNRTRSDRTSILGYEESAGYLPLRRSIAEYLAVHRGDHCDPEQILIVPGSHFAFHLATLLLSNPGDKVWLEDPGPDNVRGMLKAMGRIVADIDVDHDGMDVAGAIREYGDARLAFAMPSRQHPLGVTLSLPRRIRLLEWAQANNCWIIEDDYDSEFRYSGRPLASMRSIDATQSVIYVGTFSKSLFPALRIAYLVLPEPLIGTFRNAFGAISRSVSTLDQATLADFINEGHFAAYIRQMHDLYDMRKAMFLEKTRQSLHGLLDIDVPESGINTIGWLPAGVNDMMIYQTACKAGVYSQPLSMFRERPSEQGGLVLGFASADEAEMERKLNLLASVLENSGT